MVGIIVNDIIDWQIECRGGTIFGYREPLAGVSFIASKEVPWLASSDMCMIGNRFVSVSGGDKIYRFEIAASFV